MDPSIELVYFDGCPFADRARRNVGAALRALGLRGTWTEWDVFSDSTPDHVRGHGSPTVLVNGRDVIGSETRSTGGAPACRVEGPPSVEQIVRALGGTPKQGR